MQGLGVKKSSSIFRQTSFNSSPIPLSYSNYLLDEPGGLQSILYRELTGNRERQMKLIALYDAQRSAKSANTSFLRSAKSHKNSQGLEDSSTTGMHSTEGSKLEVPLLLKYTDAAEGAGSQVTAEETRVVKEVTQSSRFSSAKTSTAVSSTTTAAESQVPGQKQQLPLLAKTCSRTDSDAGTKNPGMDMAMVLEHQLGVMGKLRHKAEVLKSRWQELVRYHCNNSTVMSFLSLV